MNLRKESLLRHQELLKEVDNKNSKKSKKKNISRLLKKSLNLTILM